MRFSGEYSGSGGGPASDADKLEAKQYIERHGMMRAKRTNWENHWQECYQYIVPRKEDVISQLPPGSRRNDELFDTTAIMANQNLSANLHGMLTNPSMRFFELIMGDAILDEDEQVKEWLETVGDRMFITMNNSNFQTEVHEIYTDEGAIGTGCMFIGEDKEKIVHFNTRAMKEIYIDENNLGLIDTVHREFKWKIKQMIQEFGEKKIPAVLMEKYKKGNEDEFIILHCVHPMPDGDPAAKTKDFKFKSVYLLKEEQLFLSKDAFREFPYAVPRWTKTSGEIYGRGPGMEMLPDIKMVNKMMQTTLEGAAITVFPPVLVEDDSVIGKVRMTPAGVTVVRAGSKDAVKPFMTDARIDFGYQAVEDVRKRIRAGFYTDKMQLNDGPQKTATEVTQLVDEQWRFMGPVLGRQHFEFLRPVIERVFAIMARLNLFPAAPPQIQGKKFDVRYSSLAARAQRASEGQNFSRAIQVAAPLLQVKQESLDILDGDKALRYILELYGVPVRLQKNDRDIRKIRDERQKAQAKAAQQEQEAHQADAASKVLPGVAQLKQAQAQK